MQIRIQNLNKSFGRTVVCDNVNLQIASGELLALLGPSGSGKTSLLRVLAGLELPDSGSVHFDERDVTWADVRSRNIGFVFQHYALFAHMTVADNVAFGLTVLPASQRPSKKEIAERVAHLLDKVQLAPLAKRYPHQLSGGQRQRVALARALATQPKVLLLDEPFGALDAKVRKELRRWLRQIHHDMGVTSIFVTHDQEEALEVADRVVVINQGRIEQQGTPQQVWDNPASPFVYGFLGDVNLFKGRANDGRVYLDDGMQLESPEAQHADDARAFAYVRPHDLDVERYSPGQALDAHGRPRGIVVQLARAIVVGPIARLELIPEGDTQSADNAPSDALIEAQIPAQQFHEMGLREGETLVVTPRRAKVFLDEAAGI